MDTLFLELLCGVSVIMDKLLFYYEYYNSSC